MSHVNKVQPIRVKMIRNTRKNDMHSSNTCEMYMCRLRRINDSVLSSLKMEGIRLLFFCQPHTPQLLFVLGGEEVGGLLVIILQF
jgi:hypothetical protein